MPFLSSNTLSSSVSPAPRCRPSTSHATFSGKRNRTWLSSKGRPGLDNSTEYHDNNPYASYQLAIITPTTSKFPATHSSASFTSTPPNDTKSNLRPMTAFSCSSSPSSSSSCAALSSRQRECREIEMRLARCKAPKNKPKASLLRSELVLRQMGILRYARDLEPRSFFRSRLPKQRKEVEKCAFRCAAARHCVGEKLIDVWVMDWDHTYKSYFYLDLNSGEKYWQKPRIAWRFKRDILTRDAKRQRFIKRRREMKKKKKEYEAQCPFKQRSRQTLKYYQSLTKNTTTDQRSKPIGKQSLDLILSREFRKPPPPPKPEYKPPPPKVIPGLVIASIPRSLFVSSSFSSVLDPLQGASSRDKEGERDKEKASGRKKDPGKKTKRRDGAGEGGKKVWETKGRANLKERGGARLSGGRQGMKEATKGADIRGEGARDQKRKHLREMRENGRRQRRRMISSTIDSKAKVDTRKGRGEESGGMEPDIDIPRIISKISNRTWNLTSLSLSGVGLSPRFFLIPLFRALRVDRVIQFLDISCNELTRGECTGADRHGFPTYAHDPSAIRELSTMIKFNNTITHLNLENTKLRDGDICRIACAMLLNHTLRSLNVAQCSFSLAGAMALRRALSAHRADVRKEEEKGGTQRSSDQPCFHGVGLRRGDVRGGERQRGKERGTRKKKRKGGGILALNLSSARLERRELRMMVDTVASHTNIEEFTLNHCGLVGDNIAHILGPISTSRVISLSLRGNHIGAEGCYWIATLLNRSTSLIRHLCLAFCDITSRGKDRKGVVMLARALQTNETLYTLDLSGNTLVRTAIGVRPYDYRAILPLLHALRINRTLRRLDVRGNNISLEINSIARKEIEAILLERPLVRVSRDISVSLFMGKHPRLGVRSDIRRLPYMVVMYILQFLTIRREIVI